MWVYRVGAQVAKRLLFTGDLIDGKTAKDYGLALEAVPATDLNHTVRTLAERIAGVPKNQLMMHKLMINGAIDNMGLTSTQQMATLFDGITRHSQGFGGRSGPNRLVSLKPCRSGIRANPLRPRLRNRCRHCRGIRYRHYRGVRYHGLLGRRIY